MEKEDQNKQKSAVALQYEKGDKAPVITASGKGYIADKIINSAKTNNVPVHKDKGLTEALSKVEIGSYIPSELYEVVAEVLVMVDRAESKVR